MGFLRKQHFKKTLMSPLNCVNIHKCVRIELIFCKRHCNIIRLYPKKGIVSGKYPRPWRR